MADGVSIRMTDLVRELKETEKVMASSIRKNVRKAVTDAGADITAQVKASASWSTGKSKHGSIPAATTMRANFTMKSAGVRISVNRNKAPYAKEYELGNKGASPGRAWFWHPVFARRKWIFGIGQVTAKQAKRPFFFSSVVKQTPATERKMLDAINQAVIDAKFH